jgi:hypothetical protein
MPDKKDEDQKLQFGPSAGDLPLADELGIEDLSDPIFGGRGRLFSAAGRDSPVAEFTEDFLVLHAPQKPFQETGPTEDITFRSTPAGILLNEIGVPKTIGGARFRGRQLYWLRQQESGSLRHLAGWLDDDGKAHILKANGAPLTTPDVVRLRNVTHDGEISVPMEAVEIEDSMAIDDNDDADA